MRKLKLELDDLQVESFELDRRQPLHAGTVRGAAPFNPDPVNETEQDTDCSAGGGSGNIYCISASECVAPTCAFTCPDTCAHSCGGTCPPPGALCA